MSVLPSLYSRTIKKRRKTEPGQVHEKKTETITHVESTIILLNQTGGTGAAGDCKSLSTGNALPPRKAPERLVLG